MSKRVRVKRDVQLVKKEPEKDEIGECAQTSKLAFPDDSSDSGDSIASRVDKRKVRKSSNDSAISSLGDSEPNEEKQIVRFSEEKEIIILPQPEAPFECAEFRCFISSSNILIHTEEHYAERWENIPRDLKKKYRDILKKDFPICHKAGCIGYVEDDGEIILLPEIHSEDCFAEFARKEREKRLKDEEKAIDSFIARHSNPEQIEAARVFFFAFTCGDVVNESGFDISHKVCPKPEEIIKGILAEKRIQYIHLVTDAVSISGGNRAIYGMIKLSGSYTMTIPGVRKLFSDNHLKDFQKYQFMTVLKSWQKASLTVKVAKKIIESIHEVRTTRGKYCEFVPDPDGQGFNFINQICHAICQEEIFIENGNEYLQFPESRGIHSVLFDEEIDEEDSI